MTATVTSLVGSFDFAAGALVMLMSVAGFLSGLTMPSRDMIVRAVTPPGAYGRVFGFVSTGFNIGGIVSPLIFGQLLDRDAGNDPAQAGNAGSRAGEGWAGDGGELADAF